MDHLQHEISYRGDISPRSSKKITICGVGALGSWLSEILARQGYDSITVIDMDKVETKNLGTQNYSKSDIGRSKAVQCANNIIKKVGTKVSSIAKELTKDNAKSMLRGNDLVIDVFDEATSRQVVMDTCKELSIPCVHAGISSSGFSEIEWNERYTVRAQSDISLYGITPCEYPMACNLVLFTVVILAEIINKFCDQDIKESAQFTLNDMKVDNMNWRQHDKKKDKSG